VLPLPSDPAFPAALKARREARGLSRSALARAANIHVVMPRRYEDADCADFTHPRHDTWVALNRALGYDAPDDGADLPVRDEEVATHGADSHRSRPLTIAQAKAGLALTFDVDPSNIDITIRG
jgi:transcriptional regulator with XRE-family HTH domain